MADCCFVLLIAPDCSHWAAAADGTGLCLPRLTVSEALISAQEAELTVLQNALQNAFDLQSLPMQFFETPGGGNCLTSHAAGVQLPSALKWCDREQSALLPRDERELVEGWFACQLGEADSLPVAWWNPGWQKKTTDWIDDVLARKGTRRTGPARLTRGWYRSALLKVPAEGETLFLKAVPEYEPDEAALAVLLSAWMPEAFPKIVESVPRMLLMHEVPGQHLAPESNLADWLSAVRAFALLQIASLQQQESWKQQRMAYFPLQWYEQALQKVHDQAPYLLKGSPDALTDDELHMLQAAAPVWIRRLQEMAAHGIPDALEHGDLHVFNLRCHGQKTVFFDLTDVCISHPFFCRALTAYSGDLPALAGVQQNLRDAYLQPWHELMPHVPLEEAYDMAVQMEAVRVLGAIATFLQWVYAKGGMQRFPPCSPSAWAVREEQMLYAEGLRKLISSA